MHDPNPHAQLDTVILSRSSDLGDGFEVRRALPARQRRMVGPFAFLDQMGPASFEAGHGLDVRPHPHIGLATVTYLFEGEIMHRDSLGSEQRIQPGAVNWMTAGRGITHSERTAQDTRAQPSRLFGLQCWVALPRADEQCAPAFDHIPATALPTLSDGGAVVRVIAGSCFGQSSPAPTRSALGYADIVMQPGSRLPIAAEYPEQALYVVSGELDLGRDGRFGAGQLLVLKPGAALSISAAGPGITRLALLGGEPMDGPRYISWNFVSSSLECIRQAQQDWQEQRFPQVPGESEFIPLPATLGQPIPYPPEAAP